MVFNQNEWKLLICADTPKQKDGTSFGLYVLSYVYFRLTQSDFTGIENQNKFRKWIGNVITHYVSNQNIDLSNVVMEPTDLYEITNGEVELTETVNLTENLIQEIQGSNNDDICS